MPRILLLALLLLPFRVFCQEGLVLVYFGDNRIRERPVHVYSAPYDTVPVKTYAGDRALESAVAPFLGAMGSSNVIYRCAGETHARWAIIEEETEKIYWLAKDSLNRYMTWGEWWTGADCVSSAEPLRTKPDDRAPQTKLPEKSGHYFTVEAVQGDWLLVSMGATCDPMDVPENLPAAGGWVRWRKNGKIVASVTMPE